MTQLTATQVLQILLGLGIIDGIEYNNVLVNSCNRNRNKYTNEGMIGLIVRHHLTVLEYETCDIIKHLFDNVSESTTFGDIATMTCKYIDNIYDQIIITSIILNIPTLQSDFMRIKTLINHNELNTLMENIKANNQR